VTLIFGLLAVVILSGAAGDVSVTRGMKSVGEVSGFRPFQPWMLLAAASRVFCNGFIWLGIACKTVSFFSFLALLSRADLSWVVPAGASVYVVDTLAAKYLLGESINRMRWAGTLCVGLGVALISLSAWPAWARIVELYARVLGWH
jgi:drug/metabolite transporter (DMT)-like permease